MTWKELRSDITVSITVMVFFGSILTLFVNYKTGPIYTKAEANEKQIEEVKKCMDERPTKAEIDPKLESIKEDVTDIKVAQQGLNDKLDDMNKLLVDILRRGK